MLSFNETQTTHFWTHVYVHSFPCFDMKNSILKFVQALRYTLYTIMHFNAAVSLGMHAELQSQECNKRFSFMIKDCTLQAKRLN